MDIRVTTDVTTAMESLTNSYTSANESLNEPLVPHVINSYYDESGSWMFSSHDIPILIGAAAGAIGLIIIFLLAALIWHCCQFALQREKSSYSLDSERNSVSSRGSNLYINNPIDPSIMIDQKTVVVVGDHSDQNLKRSISAPIHKDNGVLQNTGNTQTPVTKANDLNGKDENGMTFQDSNHKSIDSNLNTNSNSIGIELNDKESEKRAINCQRSHLYLSNHNLNEDINSLKSRSLPWSQSNKRRTVTIDDECEEFSSKISFSKKRKNRMRNDSAAAIAMNRSGTDPHNKTHKDTDTLVDNEAIVVYDERTAL